MSSQPPVAARRPELRIEAESCENDSYCKTSKIPRILYNDGRPDSLNADFRGGPIHEQMADSGVWEERLLSLEQTTSHYVLLSQFQRQCFFGPCLCPLSKFFFACLMPDDIDGLERAVKSLLRQWNKTDAGTLVWSLEEKATETACFRAEFIHLVISVRTATIAEKANAAAAAVATPVTAVTLNARLADQNRELLNAMEALRKEMGR